MQVLTADSSTGSVPRAKVQEFLKVDRDFGYGSGRGDSDGDSDGDGRGDSDGAGDGYGTGSGCGYGCGAGYGDGRGNGTGNGTGYGDGRGNGTGNGYGWGYGARYRKIEQINHHTIYMIDRMPTVITHVHGNVAKGYLVNPDLSFTPCYIVKFNDTFTFGETLEEALVTAAMNLSKGEEA